MIDYNTENFKTLRKGEWLYGFDKEFGVALERCAEICFNINSLPPSRKPEKESLFRELLGGVGDKFVIHSPFRCDFGFHIHIGNNFVGNFNLSILDEAEVTIGNNVFIGPNTTLCTIIHALDADKRNEGIMRALPITICDDVWIASNVVILPGVTIGKGAVIGAGSVVTKDVEPLTVVAGNPAKPIRKINRRDL